jgi:hypothetical protein
MSKESIERAKRAQELMNKSKTEPTSNNPNDVDITELDNALNNIHKPFEELTEDVSSNELENTSQQIGVDNGGIQDVVSESIKDPDKEIPHVGTPLSEQVKQRSYAQSNTNPVNPLEEEPIIPEPAITSATNNPTNATNPADNPTASATTQPKVTKPSVNPPLAEMSQTERRKNAEKTADIALTAYAEFLPVLPKYFSGYDMAKMEGLEMKKEIRLSMVINDDGLTIREYMESTNEKVDKIFVVTDEMKEAIRPALIDVLMEKELVTTPMQRLIAAVGQQVLTVGVATFKLAMEGKRNMETFKEFKSRENAGQKGEKQSVQSEPEQKTQQHSTQQTNNVTESDAKIVSESVNMTMDDIIPSTNNAGITIIEEFPTDNNN